MSVSFDQIPANLNVPLVYTEFSNTAAFSGPATLPHRVLLFGQMLESGNAQPGQMVRIASADVAGELAGVGSMLHNMAQALFSDRNYFQETWMIPVEDAEAGAEASGSITPGGAPTVSGTLALYIAGRRVAVGITGGASLSSIATAISEAINAVPDLPVTAEVGGEGAATVTIVAKHAGEVGNEIDIRINHYDGERTPNGLTIDIGAMEGGTGNPDMADAVAIVGDQQFTQWVWPYNDGANIAIVTNELAQRWGPLYPFDGIAYTYHRGTFAETAAFADSLNSPHLTVMPRHGLPRPGYEGIARKAGVIAGAAEIDPARPVQTLALSWELAPNVNDRFQLTERNQLLSDGASTWYVDAGGEVRIEREVTTYKVNAFGAPDISYMDIETIYTLSYLRYDWNAYIQRKYPRHKLANDGTRYGVGQKIVTPKTMKGEAVARFRVWEDIGLVEGADQFKRDLVVVRNAANPNRLDTLLPPDLVNQLRIVATLLEFRL